ncbi:MAG: hypothetical protein ABI833_22125, partial [Acidobacteriota bacterium]
MDFRDRLRQGRAGQKFELSVRFAPLCGTMRLIGDHSDLESLRKTGIGFIINIRPKQSKVHLVDCE